MRSWLVLLAALALVPSSALMQEKGGEDEFGPYEVVANWPQPIPGTDGLHVGIDRRRVRRNAGPGVDRPARHAAAAGRREVRRAASGPGHRRAGAEMAALHLRRRSQRPHGAVVDPARQHLRREGRARAAQDQDEPVRSAEARVDHGRQPAPALQVHLRRQARADVGRSARARRGRAALRPADRHRLAARRHVLRQRRLHEHARRQVLPRRQVPDVVGHVERGQGQPRPERDAHGAQRRGGARSQSSTCRIAPTAASRSSTRTASSSTCGRTFAGRITC